MNILLFSEGELQPSDLVAPDRVAPDRTTAAAGQRQPLPADAVRSGSITLRDRRARHLHEVLAVRPGDTLRVGMIGGPLGMGTVVALEGEAVTLTVSVDTAPPPRLPLTLILALPRPKMLARILRSATEAGVRDIHLINSYRVEKSFWQSPLLTADSLHDILLLGAEQAGDCLLPDVHCHKRFKPFVEDLLPGLIAGRQALLAHPGTYPPCPRERDGDTALVVGPEGGFIPYEVEKLREGGCRPVSLGPRILRVETAVSFLLGRLA